MVDSDKPGTQLPVISETVKRTSDAPDHERAARAANTGMTSIDTTARKEPPKTNTPNVADDGYLYDTTLTQLDVGRGTLIFTVGEATHRVTYAHVSSFSPGAIGRLRLPTDAQEFAFHVYADQRLRRAPALDEPRNRRWGWRIGERQFTVQAGLVPGRAGKVIRLDTQTMTLDLPREFLRFCETRGLTPESVLRAFVADLCGLMNYFVCPREDGYSSSGSDERLSAMEYFQRTWGWVDEPQYRATLKAVKRGARKHD
jgi:hypothetical protein